MTCDGKLDCFGHINPDCEKCVPRCPLFEECYNEMQRREST
jgi:hypothetical protein